MNQQYILYRQQMSWPASKPENQTLFEFLKRKQSPTVAPLSPPPSHGSIKGQQNDPSLVNQTRYATQLQQKASSRKGILKQRVNNLSQRGVDSDEPKPAESAEKHQQHRSRSKSFVSLISPHKNSRSVQSGQDKHTDGNETKRIQGRKANIQENRHKEQKVTQRITKIESCLLELQHALKTIKDKAHGLSVAVEPLLRKMGECYQSAEARNMIRSLEEIVGAASTERINQQLNSFKLQVEAEVKSEQARLRTEAQDKYGLQVQLLKQQLASTKSGLEAEYDKIVKERDGLWRKVDKLTSLSQALREEATEKDNKHSSMIESSAKQWRQKLRQVASHNQSLIEETERMMKELVELNKELRRLRQEKDNSEEQFRQESSQLLDRKEGYLLNEISVLKGEFATDLKRLDSLHRVKEEELKKRLTEKQEELAKERFERECDQGLEVRVMEEAGQLRRQVGALRERNECIVTDMHRMNEELYQHWLALKDIRQLSRRLGTYPHLEAIFADLHFNDHLFH